MSEHLQTSQSWTALTAAWREIPERGSIDVVALRTYVDAESRRMVWWLGLEICLTVIIVGLATANLVRHPDVRIVIQAADAWIVAALVWLFALYGRRGLWRRSGATTLAYLNLARRRALLRARTAWLALGLLVAQWTVVSATIGPVEASRSLVAWSATVGWLVWAIWAAQRARREVRRLDSVIAQFENEPE